MPHDYDVLIAGAGPAGCAAAFDLAQAGRRVLLLDKRHFPRPKACACGLTRKTLKALRYDVSPVVERTCREIVLQQAGSAFASGARSAAKALEVRVRTRHPICAMAVRSRFDEFCLQQTLSAGSRKDASRSSGSASLRKIEGILALRELPTHIELTVALADGTTEILTAPVLLGADGSNGQTRRLAAELAATSHATSAALPAEPAWYQRGFALEATVPYAALPAHLPAGDAPQDLVFDFSPILGGYGWLFPKGDHINIGVGGFVPESAADRSRPHEAVTRTLLASYTQTKLGLDLSAVPATHITGQYLGLGGDRYIPRGRVLLTGDAAGLVDPLTGEGIHSAIVSGQAAAAAVLDLNPAQTDAAEALAAAYARRLAPLQETLAFSRRAAGSFYREPDRGFRAMKVPVLRQLILKTYADGLSHTRLLTRLATTVR